MTDRASVRGGFACRWSVPEEQHADQCIICGRGGSRLRSGGWEGVALGRGEADIECGFELAAKLDQVEGISTKVVDERRIQPQSGRRKVKVPRDDGLDPTLD